ncbi:MAG: DHH family phosphoesterase, partial [Spirochaetota bacterium]
MKQGFSPLESYLNKYDSFVITTHESPDPDGLGAEIAFIEFLGKIGKKYLIFNADETPEKYRFLDENNQITIMKEDTPLPEGIEKYGLFILDTNDYENTGTVYSRLKEKICEPFIIDHHSSAEIDPERHFIDGIASSTSQMVYYIFLRYGKEMSYTSALSLYAGMLFDTGSFRYPKTSSSTFMAAAAMVDAGV